MDATEGEATSEVGPTEIVTNAEQLDGSVIFHVVKDVLGFILYMHQQIPSVLQDISLEFSEMQTESKELEDNLKQTEVKASLRRQHMGRMREVKQGIRRLQKFMNTISSLETALQLIISEIPSIQEVILVLGASPIRPQHVYEMTFSHTSAGSGTISHADFAKSRTVEGLSRKAIRALISNGAGSSSYPGPSKLFLLVKAPLSFNLPLHFLPKRDFRYSKKIVPFRLRFKCRTQGMDSDPTDCGLNPDRHHDFKDSTSNELMWFQCRHVIKGIAFKTPKEE
ncbi:hypothetical protein SLE2022_244900 [Rubroshorea leprosula]